MPTWNYAVVHASRGKLRVYSEPERLRDFLDRLTATHEAGEPAPWKPADAPQDYIDGLLRAIVGIEIAVSANRRQVESQPEPAGSEPDCGGGRFAESENRGRFPDGRSDPEKAPRSVMMDQNSRAWRLTN